MRIVAALFKHQTNTFSPFQAGWDAFGADGPLAGEEAVAALAGMDQPFAAFIDFARTADAELVVPLAGRAPPGGLVRADAFERASKRLLAALTPETDLVLLDLDGSMVTEHLDDADAELVARLRKQAPHVPIGVALDFHANISNRMVEAATIVVGHRTYPHAATYETGERVVRLTARVIGRTLEPKMALARIPMLAHTLRMNTTVMPMRALTELAQRAELGAATQAVSVFGGLHSSDVPHAGVSIVAIDRAFGGISRAVVDEIAREAWEQRSEFAYKAEPLSSSVARARAMSGAPILLVDHADSASTGGTQDTMHVVREMVAQDLRGAAIGPIRDPTAVSVLVEAGLGATVTLALGGKTDMPALGLKGEPLTLTGAVRAISDGRFRIDGPVLTGTQMEMGRTVWLESEGRHFVVCERACEPFHLNVFRTVGIDVRRMKYILVKSTVHYRAAYEPISRAIIECSGAGVATADPALLRYRKLRRPIYPLDGDFDPAPGCNPQ
jgi:microcystin degradation protein MlrC